MMKLNGFGVYRLYLALKMHFKQDSYDYFKYQGKVRASEDTYNNRRDRWHFEKLAKKYDSEEMVDFFVSNMKTGTVEWIGEYLHMEAHKTFVEHTKYMQSLAYNFENEITVLLSKVPKASDLFKTDNPPILGYYLDGTISLETLCIINRLTDFQKKFDEKISDDFMWETVRKTLVKYSPFVNIDKYKYGEIFRKKVMELA